MDHKQRIKDYLARSVAEPVADHDDIFARGLVNSLFALQLVDYIQNEFHLTVENEDLDLDNFSSIDAMVAFVGRKLSSVAA